MFSIFKKEINSFFSSLIGYLVIVLFISTTGIFMFVLKEFPFLPVVNVLDYGFATMDTLFVLGPWVFLFLIPAITMRMLAEEKRTGTIELLLTRPLSDMQIILGKYFASLVLVVFSLLPTRLYYFSIYQLGNPVGNIDSAGTFGSYIGLLMLGFVFCAIGVFSSSITDNQIVAFITAVILSFFIFLGFNLISQLDFWGSTYTVFIDNLGIASHYSSMSRGLIDSRDVFYFVSVIVIMLFATKLSLESRKW